MRKKPGKVIKKKIDSEKKSETHKVENQLEKAKSDVKEKIKKSKIPKDPYKPLE